MALTLDNAPSTRQLVASNTVLTYSFTYAGGPGAIYVGVLVTHTNSPVVSSITWNGQALSKLAGHISGVSNKLENWRLLNPSGSGAANIVITITASTNYILATTLSILGDIGAGGTTNVSATGSNTISVADGSWVVITGASDTVDVAASTNVTATPTANPVTGYYGPKSGAGDITLSYTGTGAYSVAVEVVDNAAGSGGLSIPVVMNQYRQRLL